MLDKLIEWVKVQRGLKRVCIFFLAFAASLTVMGSSHDIFYGSGSQMAPEQAPTASSSDAEEAQDNTNGTLVSYAQTNPGFPDGFMLAVTATQLEEIVTAAVEDKKESEKAESKARDEEGAEDEAESAKQKTKTSTEVTKADPEAEDTAKTKKKGKAKGEEIEGEENESEPSGFVYSDQIPMSRELQQYTYEKCVERGLEYELVLAIIWRESRFTVNAVNVNANGTRDNGIMQINDVNRKWLKDNYGITDLMDPYQNIDAGTAMLGNLTSKYGSHNAMMAYQYGEGGMAKRLKQGITTSTAIEQAYKQRDYYRKIL